MQGHDSGPSFWNERHSLAVKPRVLGGRQNLEVLDPVVPLVAVDVVDVLIAGQLAAQVAFHH